MIKSCRHFNTVSNNAFMSVKYENILLRLPIEIESCRFSMVPVWEFVTDWFCIYIYTIKYAKIRIGNFS